MRALPAGSGNAKGAAEIRRDLQYIKAGLGREKRGRSVGPGGGKPRRRSPPKFSQRAGG
jgi:hypothetical protein